MEVFEQHENMWMSVSPAEGAGPVAGCDFLPCLKSLSPIEPAQLQHFLNPSSILQRVSIFYLFIYFETFSRDYLVVLPALSAPIASPKLLPGVKEFLC